MTRFEDLRIVAELAGKPRMFMDKMDKFEFGAPMDIGAPDLSTWRFVAQLRTA